MVFFWGGHSIPWLISKTSLITRTQAPTFNSTKVDAVTISANSGATFRIKAKTGGEQNTVTWQNSVLNPSNKVYDGPYTDAFDYNTRSTFSRLHLDGYESDGTGKSGLQQSAEQWVSKVSNASINNPLSPLALNKIQLTKSGSNYSLTILNSSGSQITIGNFYWVKNEGGIQYNVSTSNNINIPQNSGETDYIITCYYQPNSNSALTPSQPYFVKQTCSGCRVGGGSTSIVRNIATVPSAGNTYTEPIDNFKDGAFPIPGNCLGWAFLTYDVHNDNYIINVQANGSSSSRSGTITVTNSNNNSITKTINITQAGSAITADLALTTLTPTSSTVGAGTINYNGLNIAGNTMKVSGQTYTQGIGTHSQSSIVYTIPTGYTHFNGLVGRDDGSDNCGCGSTLMNFQIKLNGSTAWSSSAHGESSDAQSFSVPLNGATQLELFTDYQDGSYYGDWGDWINPVLSGSGEGSTGSPAPPHTISANPTTVAPNATSQLYATCAQGVVTWSTNATGSPVSVNPSVTTTYNVNCVDGSAYSTSEAVTVNVAGGGGSCSIVTNNLVMGTWSVTGDQLVSRYLNGSYWLVQKVNVNGAQYDEFVVRGSEMLTRRDVSLTNSSYSGLVNCYSWQYSAYGGLLGPNATSSPPFPTPGGFYAYTTQDGTPYSLLQQLCILFKFM